LPTDEQAAAYMFLFFEWVWHPERRAISSETLGPSWAKEDLSIDITYAPIHLDGQLL